MSEQENGRRKKSNPGKGTSNPTDVPATTDDDSPLDYSTSFFLSSSATESSATTRNGSAAPAVSSTTGGESSTTIFSGSAVATDGSAATTDGSGTTPDCSATTTPDCSATANDGSATAEADGSAAKSGSSARFTTWQSSRLEAEFIYCKYLTLKRRAAVATELRLTEDQVKNWFARKRAKRKMQQKRQEKNSTPRQPPPPALPLVPDLAQPAVNPFALTNPNLCGAPEMARVHNWIQYGHQFPPETFREVRVGGQPYVPNYYLPTNQLPDGVPLQQLPDARGDVSRYPANPGPSREPAGRDRSSPWARPGSSRDPPPAQGSEARAQGVRRGGDYQGDQLHDPQAAARPRVYHALAGQLPGPSRQHPPDARTTSGRGRSRSPADHQDPSLDPVPGLEIEVAADAGEGVPHAGDSRRELVHKLNVSSIQWCQQPD